MGLEVVMVISPLARAIGATSRLKLYERWLARNSRKCRSHSTRNAYLLRLRAKEILCRERSRVAARGSIQEPVERAGASSLRRPSADPAAAASLSIPFPRACEQRG